MEKLQHDSKYNDLARKVKDKCNESGVPVHKVVIGMLSDDERNIQIEVWATDPANGKDLVGCVEFDEMSFPPKDKQMKDIILAVFTKTVIFAILLAIFMEFEVFTANNSFNDWLLGIIGFSIGTAIYELYLKTLFK